jgi:hypothetical protein
VNPDPHGKVPDPCIYGLGLQVWSRTSDLHVCKPDPWNGIQTPCAGFEPHAVGSQGYRIEHTRALNRTQAGVRCRHVSRPDLVGSEPYHIHPCAPSRRRPDVATWPTTCGVIQRTKPGIKPLGASLHLLRIRREPVHSSDRRRVQSTLRGPCSYSHVTIARAMTHHYSCVSKKRVTAYQCCMDCSHDSR